jgi:hypothetical protein
MLVMVQLLPGQMVVAALVAALLRANIPISIMTCWISNPATFIFFIWLQEVIGGWALPRMPLFFQTWMASAVGWIIDLVKALPTGLRSFIPDDLITKGVTYLSNMYFGGLVLGVALCAVSYPISWLIWEWISRCNAKRDARYQLPPAGQSL